jgi:hypothetical protein
MELVALIVLLIGGIAGVAWFNRPKTEVKAPEQEVDTTPPVKGGGSDAVVKDAKQLAKMTKAEVEDFARTCGVELDRRKTKANMIADFLQKRK